MEALKICECICSLKPQPVKKPLKPAWKNLSSRNKFWFQTYLALNAETGIKILNLVSQSGRFGSEQPIARASVAKLD